MILTASFELTYYNQTWLKEIKVYNILWYRCDLHLYLMKRIVIIIRSMLITGVNYHWRCNMGARKFIKPDCRAQSRVEKLMSRQKQINPLMLEKFLVHHHMTLKVK